MTALEAGTNTAADVEAVDEIMRRGGSELRERMARAETYLEQVTAESGMPLASHATATIVAGGKRLRPLLVMLAAESAAGPIEGARGRANSGAGRRRRRARTFGHTRT